MIAWLGEQLDHPPPPLASASADASFRRYWRLESGATSLIAVDAPPETEDNAAFVRLAREFAAIGLNVPDMIAADLSQGFLLVGDLGSRHYLDHLHATNADRLYGDAINALVTLQASGPRSGLPDYDEPFLRRELAIFDEWLLSGLLAMDLRQHERHALDVLYTRLVDSALAQPTVCVHRDYHSRNLMLTEHRNPGILDFQDAVLGPVSYDLVSLLRDCYIEWPEQRVQGWMELYLDRAVGQGVLRDDELPTFPKWFDLMGIQRHLKAAGIFARLALRDGRPSYLRDLPRTLGYVRRICGKYGELHPIAEFIGRRVLPGVQSHLG
jgi:aminoglycoside/choline kinase family phosphotransferase